VVPGGEVNTITAVHFYSGFSACGDGTILAGNQNNWYRLFWLSREGKILSSLTHPDLYVALQISPDGTRAVLSAVALTGTRNI
jgi:hypothetical protein